MRFLTFGWSSHPLLCSAMFCYCWEQKQTVAYPSYCGAWVTGCHLPSLHDLYLSQTTSQAGKMEAIHPSKIVPPRRSKYRLQIVQKVTKLVCSCICSYFNYLDFIAIFFNVSKVFVLSSHFTLYLIPIQLLWLWYFPRPLFKEVNTFKTQLCLHQKGKKSGQYFKLGQVLQIFLCFVFIYRNFMAPQM